MYPVSLKSQNVDNRLCLAKTVLIHLNKYIGFGLCYEQLFLMFNVFDTLY